MSLKYYSCWENTAYVSVYQLIYPPILFLSRVSGYFAKYDCSNLVARSYRVVVTEM